MFHYHAAWRRTVRGLLLAVFCPAPPALFRWAAVSYCGCLLLGYSGGLSWAGTARGLLLLVCYWTAGLFIGTGCFQSACRVFTGWSFSPRNVVCCLQSAPKAVSICSQAVTNRAAHAGERRLQRQPQRKAYCVLSGRYVMMCIHHCVVCLRGAEQ
jgi:hypothetical protein